MSLKPNLLGHSSVAYRRQEMLSTLALGHEIHLLKQLLATGRHKSRKDKTLLPYGEKRTDKEGEGGVRGARKGWAVGFSLKIPGWGSPRSGGRRGREGICEEFGG